MDDISSMKIKAILMTMFLSLGINSAIAGDGGGYCDAPKGSQQWEKVVSKYKYFSTWQSLHRLRSGLCQQVERGSISLNEAATTFEKEKAKKMRILRERKNKIRGRKRVMLG